MSICAVVVTYNRLDKLKHTLSAYLATPIHCVVVVNNASTDETKIWLTEQAAQDERIKAFHLEHNSGGSGGFAFGLSVARELKGIDWIVVSDDDSYPKTGTIEHFQQTYGTHAPLATEAKQHPVKPAIIASAVYYPQEGICPMNRPMAKRNAMGYLQALLSGHKLTGLNDAAYRASTSVEILAASFVGLWINQHALKTSQILPEKDYFLYWDDIAFCLDFAQQGYELQFDPNLKFEHDCYTRQSVLPAGKKLYWLVRNGLRTMNRLPTLARLLAKLYKLPIWLLMAIKTQSVSHFIQAIKDV